jgi:hypothetical protein
MQLKLEGHCRLTTECSNDATADSALEAISYPTSYTSWYSSGGHRYTCCKPLVPTVHPYGLQVNVRMSPKLAKYRSQYVVYCKSTFRYIQVKLEFHIFITYL